MSKEEYIILELTTPPTLSQCFVGYPNKHKSDKYKNWEKINQYANEKWYKLTWDEWLEITLNYLIPIYYKNWKKKKIDLDNFFKATLDHLSKIITWFKDENIKKINAKKTDSKANIVKILIKEIK